MRAACIAAADRLLSLRHPRLLAVAELVRGALADMREGATTDPTRAVVHAYSQALHRACSGDEGEERRQLGYTELFHYLHTAARRQYPEVCDDAAQQALERIYRRFDACQGPGTFLAFALQLLSDAARVLRRQRQATDWHQRSLDASTGGSTRMLGDALADGGQSDPLAGVLREEQLQRVADSAAELLRRHPRARRQLVALLLKYRDGMDDAVIAVQLGTTVANVHVLRARAAAKLQTDENWRELAAEFGLSVGSRPPAPKREAGP
jgi:RNA polymerase sigma factor (sigma-70 family)